MAKKELKLHIPATKKDIQDWAYIFRVLGDEIRLSILKEIIDNDGISGKEILINLKLSQPTLSFHLKQLAEAGIIKFVKDGQTHCYSINVDNINKYYGIVGDARDVIYKTVINKK